MERHSPQWVDSALSPSGRLVSNDYGKLADIKYERPVMQILCD